MVSKLRSKDRGTRMMRHFNAAWKTLLVFLAPAGIIALSIWHPEYVASVVLGSMVIFLAAGMLYYLGYAVYIVYRIFLDEE